MGPKAGKLLLHRGAAASNDAHVAAAAVADLRRERERGGGNKGKNVRGSCRSPRTAKRTPPRGKPLGRPHLLAPEGAAAVGGGGRPLVVLNVRDEGVEGRHAGGAKVVRHVLDAGRGEMGNARHELGGACAWAKGRGGATLKSEDATWPTYSEDSLGVSNVAGRAVGGGGERGGGRKR